MKKDNNLIVVKTGDQELSRAQKQFNTNLKKVQALQAEIDKYEKLIPEIRSAYHAIVEPARRLVGQAMMKHLLLFDRLTEDKMFRKLEKEKLKQITLDYCDQLITHFGMDEVIPIYDKHAAFSHEEQEKAMKEMQKTMAETMFNDIMGLDVNFDENEEFDEMAMLEKVKEQMKEKIMEEKEQYMKKKKTVKEKREDALYDKTTKTIKQLYNGLVKKLHPDAEKDEKAREEKTRLMQEITRAYKENNFVKLLSYHAQTEKENKLDFGAMPDKELNFYTKILKEQLEFLETKIESLLDPGHHDRQDSLFLSYLEELPNYKKAMEEDAKAIKRNAKNLEKGYLELCEDKTLIRDVLREYKIDKHDKWETK